MIVGAMIVGLGGAVLSAGGALVAGASLPAAAGCYMAGGSVTMLAALAFGSRRGPRQPGLRMPPCQSAPALAG